MNVQQLFRVHVHSEIPTSQHAEKPCAHDRAVTPQGALTQTRDLVSSVLYHSDGLLNDDFTASRRRRDVPSSSPSPLPVTSSGLVLCSGCAVRIDGMFGPSSSCRGPNSQRPDAQLSYLHIFTLTRLMGLKKYSSRTLVLVTKKKSPSVNSNQFSIVAKLSRSACLP